MKLRLRDLPAFLATDAARMAGLLVHGPDAAAVAFRRDEAAAALAGPGAEAEMRLTRLSAAVLRPDPAALQDALRARGFFPGPRLVFLDEPGDGLADLLGEALRAAAPGEDAFLLVTATDLPARSRLRRLFEEARNAASLQLFDDPPGRTEVEAALAGAGLRAATPQAVAALVALGAVLDPGSFRHLIDRIALWKGGDADPLTEAEVALLAPLDRAGEVEEAVTALVAGEPSALGPALARLAGQGVAPVTLCLAALRQVRLLHAAAIDPEGPEAALARARPPVFGPRRAALLAAVRAWGVERLERAFVLLTETDRALRSSTAAPQAALLERALIRVALMKGGR